MTRWRPKLVGETSDHAPYVECVTASALNVANAASNGAHPATATEREALRTDSGAPDNAGTDLTHADKGWRTRYGYTTGVRSSTWAEVRIGLAKNRWYVVLGFYQRLPAHYRRWQSGGTFSHACTVGPGDDPKTAWWYDPLSPDGYAGEPIPLTALETFSKSMNYDALSLLEGEYAATGNQPAGGDVKFGNLNGYGVDSNRRIHLPAGSIIELLDGTNLDPLTAAGDFIILGLVDSVPGNYLIKWDAPEPSPYNDHVPRETLLLVKTAIAPTVVSPVVPDCSGPSAAAVEKYRNAILAVPTT